MLLALSMQPDPFHSAGQQQHYDTQQDYFEQEVGIRHGVVGLGDYRFPPPATFMSTAEGSGPNISKQTSLVVSRGGSSIGFGSPTTTSSYTSPMSTSSGMLPPASHSSGQSHPSIAVLHHGHHHQIQSPTTPTSVNPPGTQMDMAGTPVDIGKKRKRAKREDEGPAEPRRLRRSHEACARCRSKKIKCDSKHPRCTACTTANVQCEQEDRHRQTLTPRGYTEGLEAKLAACERLLAHRIPGFRLSDLENQCAQQGVDITSLGTLPQSSPPQPSLPSLPPSTAPGYHPHHGSQPSNSPEPPLPTPATSASMEVKGQDPHSNNVSQADAQSMLMSFGIAPLPANHTPLPGLASILNPPYQPSHSVSHNSSSAPSPSTSGESIAVSHVQNLRQFTDEDLSVGSSSLNSGRDRHMGGGVGASRNNPPRVIREWQIGLLRRASISSGGGGHIEIWLPKDWDMTMHIIDVYFERLNIHRPVYDRPTFINKVREVYATVPYHPHQAPSPQDIKPPICDEGFICSFYLVLALGTLSEANYSSEAPPAGDASPKRESLGGSGMGNNLPPSWPSHEEFFSRALGVKPDLRVTLSSLQALILLHWYLYCELQGRNLWRLVGSLVRLGIELGLHHDPCSQMHTPGPHSASNGETLTPVPVFTGEEAALRIRLWGIVLIHDRATSSLLGRPLGISPNDTNSPRPSCSHLHGDGFAEFSPHFQHSHDLASIQADIVISLYSPNASKNTSGIMRHAYRIMQSLAEFRKRLGPRYQKYFGGPIPSTTPIKQEVQSPSAYYPDNGAVVGTPMDDLTEDDGLTLLKLGFTRILLLRAIFGNKELDVEFRMKALKDSISTAHNTILIHNQLISFPSIAFFTSPIPLHINAMVILTGHIWNVGVLEHHVALEDVWLALDLLPKFRWRWERKDWGGEHPGLARLVEMVMRVDLSQIKGCSGPPVLIEEREWNESPHSSNPDPTNLRSPITSPVNSTRGSLGGGPGLVSLTSTSPSIATRSPTTSIPPPPSSLASNGYSNGNRPGSASSPTHGNGGYSLAYANPIPAGGLPAKAAVEIPNAFFYPFFPGHPAPPTESGSPSPQQANGGGYGSQQGQSGNGQIQAPHQRGQGSQAQGNGQRVPNPDLNMLFMQAAASQPDASYGCQPSQETFYSEERDSQTFTSLHSPQTSQDHPQVNHSATHHNSSQHPLHHSYPPQQHPQPHPNPHHMYSQQGYGSMPPPPTPSSAHHMVSPHHMQQLQQSRPPMGHGGNAVWIPHGSQQPGTPTSAGGVSPVGERGRGY